MKNRRTFLQKLTGLAALLAWPAANRRAMASPAPAHPIRGEELDDRFVHTVLFWLVDEREPTRKKFEKEVRTYLKEIDVIRTTHLGKPAGTDREVVDNSYSYCMIVTFNSSEDHDIYQEHPAHKAFVDNASSLWTRVRVYDSLSIHEPVSP